ncbi:type II secretion system F family protein [Rhodobacteraceae bacterium NNCM2]|nr:type II secretion system F family protein [Coraliihabitans acroporae]
MTEWYVLQATTEAVEEAPASTGLLEKLEASLIAQFGPAAPLYAIIALGLLIMVIAIPMVMKKRKDPLERFSFRESRRDDDLIELRTDNDDGRLAGFGEYLQPTDEGELSETKKMLRSAGYKDASAIRVYYFARAALGVAMLMLAVFVFLIRPEEPDAMMAMIFAALFGLFGYFLPIYWVKRQIETRRQEIENAFPDAMDMMLVCIEGGQSLDQAMARVGVEMKISAGALAEELGVVTNEFRAGKERVNVLRDFATRCSVNDISSFVTVLIQSQAFGTSVSQALRVYAAEMRDKRLMRAEEKANVLPTKLTLGTMMFTVPPLILILVGPSMIQIIRSLSGLTG